MSEKKRFVVIGAGMSGILAAIKLSQAGQDNLVVYEKAHTIGGTWRENHYPGLTCDVPAHCYTYSFAPYPDWSAFYARGPEIQGYFQKVIDDYDVRRFIQTNSEVIRCVWEDGKWKLELADGRKDEADIVIAASGVLHHPRYPDIEGLETFEGAMFHSARWDDALDPSGKRIGVVGNGSTGVQIVSALAPVAGELVHFQRSPQWILPVVQYDYTDEDRAAFRANPAKIDEIRYGDEYWNGVRRFTSAIVDPDSPQMKEIEELCLRNLEEGVRDSELRETLRPNYHAACKRLIYSWNYYDKIQEHDVAIETSAIMRVERNGIRIKNGRLYELDVIALATGFHAHKFIKPTKVLGAGGMDLDDFWARRPTAHYAVTLPSFPNFFMLNGPTGPVGNFSLIDIAERQWDYIAQLMQPVLEGNASWVAPTREAHAEYEERRIEAARNTVFGTGCTSWYLDAEGIPGTWPWSYDAFAKAMEKPNLNEFEFG